jgi:hypothetical protein
MKASDRIMAATLMVVAPIDNRMMVLEKLRARFFEILRAMNMDVSTGWPLWLRRYSLQTVPRRAAVWIEPRHPDFG